MEHLDTSIAVLRDLIAFPTVSTDSNLVMVDYLADRLEQVGAKVTRVHDAQGGKANLYATLGPDMSGGILLAGHTDVVPVADQNWTSDPFKMRAHDGRLFGRGTCDMKGFIAICIALAPEFAQAATRRPIHFAFTYDEEKPLIRPSAQSTWADYMVVWRIM